MNIARIIMDLKVSKSQIQNGNPWDNHKKAIFNEYQSNIDLYLSKIKNIVKTAKRNKVDLLLFSACTIFYLKEQEKKIYLDIFKQIPFVYSGMLFKYKSKYIENAAIISHGKIIREFDSSNIEKYYYKNRLILSAISSTIKRIKEVNQSNLVLKSNSPNIFILDMGHHQYNGRYVLTLKSVYNHIKKTYKVNPFVVLSFWKYKNANINTNWIISNKQIHLNRLFNSVGGNNDFIDCIEL